MGIDNYFLLVVHCIMLSHVTKCKILIGLNPNIGLWCNSWNMVRSKSCHMPNHVKNGDESNNDEKNLRSRRKYIICRSSFFLCQSLFIVFLVFQCMRRFDVYMPAAHYGTAIMKSRNCPLYDFFFIYIIHHIFDIILLCVVSSFLILVSTNFHSILF